MNHRNGEIGNYAAEQKNMGLIHVKCDNPYPCSFDMGILKAVVDEFGETRARISEIGNECREDGGSSCLYKVKW